MAGFLVVTKNGILETIYFEESHIVSSVKKLKPNLFSEPDSLLPLLSKELVACLSRPLMLRFN